MTEHNPERAYRAVDQAMPAFLSRPLRFATAAPSHERLVTALCALAAAAGLAWLGLALYLA